jgi:hypothetical protein
VVFQARVPITSPFLQAWHGEQDSAANRKHALKPLVGCFSTLMLKGMRIADEALP